MNKPTPDDFMDGFDFRPSMAILQQRNSGMIICKKCNGCGSISGSEAWIDSFCDCEIGQWSKEEDLRMDRNDANDFFECLSYGD